MILYQIYTFFTCPCFQQDIFSRPSSKSSTLRHTYKYIRTSEIDIFMKFFFALQTNTFAATKPAEVEFSLVLKGQFLRLFIFGKQITS